MDSFSLSNYNKIIQAFLDNGYCISPLGENIEASGKQLFLRHDVDFNLDLAVMMAEENSNLGVRSCFQLLIRSPLYNLASEHNLKALGRIAALDQTFGLHFYLPSFISPGAGNTLDEVHKLVHSDLDLLKKMAPEKVAEVMSWHNPSVFGEEHKSWIESKMPNILNAYSLEQDGIAYFADSYHRFSVDEWFSIAQRGGVKIQLNFHPCQWVWGLPTMEEVLAKTWAKTIRQMEQEYLASHIYRKSFPEGLPENGLQAWVEPLFLAAQDTRKNKI